MNITPEQIRDIAVKNVESFLNKQASLNGAVADSAKHYDLNPDQIKRVIEATNTVAYLKLQKMAEDRTFEFPVADYSEVIQEITIPDHLKQASTGIIVEAPITEKYSPNVEAIPTKGRFEHEQVITEQEIKEDALKHHQIKAAEEAEQIGLEITDHEKLAYLYKQFINNRSALEKIAVYKEDLTVKIQNCMSELNKDPEILEKIATLYEGQEYDQWAGFITGHVKEAKQNQYFRDHELNEVRNLVSLIKEAKEVVAQEQEMLKLNEKAASVLAAPFRALGYPLGFAAGAAGGAVAGTVSAAGKAVNLVGKDKVLGAAGDLMGGLFYEPRRDVWSSLHNN